MNSFNIEPLNGNNYHVWKFRMTTLLMQKDVLNLANAEFNEDDYPEAKEKLEAVRKHNLCKSLIVQCLANDQVALIQDKSSAYDMWKMLEGRYEKKGLPGQLMLKRKLMSLRLREGESLEAFLSEFEETVRQLKATGAECNEKDTVCLLLLAMPKSFEMIVTILENMSEAELTMSVAKTKLRAEAEKRRTTSDGGAYTRKENTSTAFWSRNQQGTCYFCGCRGHYKRDCRKYLQQLANGNSSDRHGRGWQKFGHHSPSRDSHGRGRQNFGERQGSRQGNSRWQTSRDRQDRTGNSRRRGVNYGESKESQQDEECDRGGICFMTNERNYNFKRCDILFYVDSGCTDHLISSKEYFSELLMLREPIKIAIARNDQYMEALGVGSIKVISNVHGREFDCTIQNVLYVPNLRRNLLSVKRLEMANIKVTFYNGQVKLYKDNDVIGIGIRNALYEIEFKLRVKESLYIESENEKFKLWHKRFGHICHSNLERLIHENMVEGIGTIKANKVEFCESCTNGKMSRRSFGTRNKARRILEIVHSDVVGPISPASYNNERFFVTFIDDYSNFVYVYPIECKSDVFECFKGYCELVQAKFNCKISTLRCDNGGEYLSKEFTGFCRRNGTFIDYSVPYTPEQNGKAERFNRSLLDKARTMVLDANMPRELWNEAIRTSAYLQNRSPSASSRVTPAEIWHGRKPDVRNLRIFGTVAYSHIPSQFRTKFEAKSDKCVMIGYSTTGYRLWNIRKQKVIVARDVTFNEEDYYFKSSKASTENRRSVEIENTQSETDEGENEVPVGGERNVRDYIEKEEDILEEEEVERDSKQRRRTRLPEKFDEFQMYMAFDAVSFVEDVPETVEDLKNRKDETMWKKAMNRELQSIKENNTWKEVKMPGKAEILDTRWVFAAKPLETNPQDRYKARLVVRGFEQRLSYNYDEIYSPVAKLTTIRTLLSMGNQKGYYFQQLDVKNAFLNGKLKEDIYIYPPLGEHCKPGCVLKLNKSLYGLKQAPKCWNDEINGLLSSLGFRRSENDYCLYVKGNVYLLLYVDDIILAGPKLDCLEKCKLALLNGFKMKDKGELRYFLGLEIQYDRINGILTINQRRYLQGILKRFRFENSRSCGIPIDPNLKIATVDGQNSGKPVKELIGCLMYLMLGSRPDLSFAVNFFSRFQDKNSDDVWTHMKRLLRYLKGTINMKLEYKRKPGGNPLTCYVDSDWAGDMTDRKSISGFVVKVFGNTVAWVTRKQKCIALSSTEAELIAMCAATQEVLWYKKVLCDMNIECKIISMYEDNQGCISIAKNPENNRRVKHIDVKYRFISECIKDKILKIEYIDSKSQMADILTKGLNRVQFCAHCTKLGLISSI